MDNWKLEPAHDHGLSPRERAKSLRREAGLIQTCTHWFWGTGVRTFLRTYNRLRIEGTDRFPAKPPFILIANHTSHLDALILASALPWRIRGQTFPIAAADVFFDNPAVIHFSATMLNALPIQRRSQGAHALATLRDRMINEPCGFILFPEGARSRDGRMLPFKSGLGRLVAGTHVPVVPCFIDGAFAALPAERKVPRPRRIIVRVGTPLAFTDLPDARDGWDAVASRAQQAVAALESQR